ncbi:MAG: hypothetical protein Q4Q58_06715 [Thermoplasmata archaeon]|nr:hypothetical protein [Thermoplasmata archaeon]
MGRTYLVPGRGFVGQEELQALLLDYVTEDMAMQYAAECMTLDEAKEFVAGWYDGVEETAAELNITSDTEHAAAELIEFYSTNGEADLIGGLRAMLADAIANGASADLYSITGIRTMRGGRDGVTAVAS